MISKISTTILAAFALLTGAVTQAQSPPEVTISNGIVQARLYLPDEQQGYYRGTRFDWAGVIFELTYQGHNYFGPWRDHDPLIHDAITGPVEYFEPLGYDEAKPGETFVKIGVGRVRKLDDRPYTFALPYEIVDYGVWEVNTQPDQVEFIHRLSDPSYPYEYRKTVKLAEGQPTLLLLHELRNTGQQKLSTQTYNHNFFVMDNRKIGPEYHVEFPHAVNAGRVTTGKDIATVSGNRFVFSREIADGESVFFGDVTGLNMNPVDYHFDIRNTHTGAGVNVTSDRPMAKLHFWANPNTICPEPYIAIDVEQAATFEWTITYNFYSND